LNYGWILIEILITIFTKSHNFFTDPQRVVARGKCSPHIFARHRVPEIVEVSNSIFFVVQIKAEFHDFLFFPTQLMLLGEA